MVSQEILDTYDMTIGIECHVQLATDTKLFSGADNDARDRSPNSVVSPIDFGLPGMLPVLNRKAVDLAIMAGKALNAEIARVSRFDRKHYFYPDLPKGYQTTQMYHPIILAGFIDAPLEDGTSVRVRIHHAHMEEDAGKLTHYDGYSLVDLNRAGTPLIEIVSEPDIHSAAAAKAYAAELHRLMTYAGVTRGDLYHGNMRFDVNVSVAKKGATELGTRAEVKNLNSFKSVEKAAEYEFRRQVERIESGERVIQETRGWDEAKQITNSQRSKEDAQDYRYMPDADIPPIILSQEEISEIQALVPTLPPEYRQKWSTFIDTSIMNALLAVEPFARAVLEVQDRYGDTHAKRAANWLTSVVKRSDEDENFMSDKKVDLSGLDINVEGLYELSKMVEASELSSTAAKQVLLDIIGNPSLDPRSIAQERNLLQVSDEGFVAGIVDAVLADPASARSVTDIKEGKDKAIGYLVGQVMKKSQGKANPAMARELIRKKLN